MGPQPGDAKGAEGGGGEDSGSAAGHGGGKRSDRGGCEGGGAGSGEAWRGSETNCVSGVHAAARPWWDRCRAHDFWRGGVENLGGGCEGVLGEVLIESAGKLNAATG